MKLMPVLILISSIASAHTEVSFSPKGNCEKMAIDLIDEANNYVEAAVYSINNIAIVEAYERARDRGVDVSILTDHVQAGSNAKVTLRLNADKFHGFRLHSVNRIQHNKFVVVDGDHVMTGSFNETTAGQQENSENCLVTDDTDIVNQYGDEFVNVLWPENTQKKSDEHLAKIIAKFKNKPKGKSK